MKGDAFISARLPAAFAAFAMLVSCGGGGGGSSSASVNTSQATVNSANVLAFANDVTTAVVVAATTRVGPDTTFPQSDFLGGSETFPSPGAGGNVSGTGTYTNFNRSAGLVVNGQVNVTSGSYGAFINNLHFSSAGLNYAPGGLVLAGTIDLVWTFPGGGVAEYTMTMNGTASVAGNPVVILENFLVDSTLSAGTETISVGGKLTDAAQGFVNVSTTTPITLVEPGGIGSGGVVVVSGGGTNKATITFQGGGQATAVITP